MTAKVEVLHLTDEGPIEGATPSTQNLPATTNGIFINTLGTLRDKLGDLAFEDEKLADEIVGVAEQLVEDKRTVLSRLQQTSFRFRKEWGDKLQIKRWNRNQGDNTGE